MCPYSKLNIKQTSPALNHFSCFIQDLFPLFLYAFAWEHLHENRLLSYLPLSICSSCQLTCCQSSLSDILIPKPMPNCGLGIALWGREVKSLQETSIANNTTLKSLSLEDNPMRLKGFLMRKIHQEVITLKTRPNCSEYSQNSERDRCKFLPLTHVSTCDSGNHFSHSCSQLTS